MKAVTKPKSQEEANKKFIGKRFKVYQVLSTIETGGSKMEQAKAIAQLINQ